MLVWLKEDPDAILIIGSIVIVLLAWGMQYF